VEGRVHELIVGQRPPRRRCGADDRLPARALSIC